MDEFICESMIETFERTRAHSRGFEIVDTSFRKNDRAILPLRKTKRSAGYDFMLPYSVVIGPKESLIIWSDIKAYMLPDEVLQIYPRSSSAIKNDIIIKNIVGIVDSDYYSNQDNDGNIGLFLSNVGTETRYLSEGDGIAQGIFIKYLVADNCNCNDTRIGGVGSTNK